MLRNLDKLKRGSSGHSLYVYARMKIVLLILIFLFVKNDQRNDNPKSMYAPKCNKGIICNKCHIYCILYDIIANFSFTVENISYIHLSQNFPGLPDLGQK